MHTTHSTATKARQILSSVGACAAMARLAVLGCFAARVFVPLVAVGIAAVACTGDPPPRDDSPRPSQSRPAASSPAVPYDEESAGVAGTFDRLRRIDPCALLNPAAAATAVGGTTHTVLPGGLSGSFGTCVADVLPEGTTSPADAWQISIDVGVRFDRAFDVEEMGATPLTINGSDTTDGTGGAGEVPEFFQEAGLGDPETDNRRCSVVHPVDDQRGVRLEVRVPLGTAPARPACEVASAYLQRGYTAWQDLPDRADGRSEPRLPLADRNPCETANTVGELLGGTPRAVPDELYTCQVITTATTTRPPASSDRDAPGQTSGTPPARTLPDTTTTPQPTASGPRDGRPSTTTVTITYSLAADPAGLEPTDVLAPVAVKTRAGSLTGMQRQEEGTCEVAVATTETTLIDTDDGGRTEVVRIKAPACDQATRVASVVLDTVTDR